MRAGSIGRRNSVRAKDLEEASRVLPVKKKNSNFATAFSRASV